MKAKKIAFYCLAALLGGCGPVLSLHPLFTVEDIVFDEQLLGTWLGDPNKPENTLEFERLDDADVGIIKDNLQSIYRLNVTGKEGNTVIRGSVIACLVKLGDRMFLDVFPDKMPQEVNAWLFVPVHMFFKVNRAGNQLKLRLTDEERFAKLLEAEPTAVKYEKVEDGRRILTASTKELQAFVLKHADDDRLFSDAGILTRKSK